MLILNLHWERLQKLMSKFYLLSIVLIIAFSSYIAGFFTKEHQSRNSYEQCIEPGAPLTDQKVTWNGSVYFLIKKNARVPGPASSVNMKPGEEDKFTLAMEALRPEKTTDTNEEVFTLKKPNFFGDPDIAFNNRLIVYVKKRIDVDDGATYFDIFLKQGENLQSPSYKFIRECKRSGGVSVVGLSEILDSFPPAGFNTDGTDNRFTNTSGVRFQPSYKYERDVPKKRTEDVERFLGVSQNVARLQVKKSGSSITLPFHMHLGILYLIDGQDAYTYTFSSETISLDQKNPDQSIQLRKVQVLESPLYSWWTPECKPAIYLYPEHPMDVHVVVEPKGYFTLTIPQYPKDGWRVFARPNGDIFIDNKVYPYLYYESQIDNQFVKKPQKGFVIEYDRLLKLYDEILPQLGLNENEAADFKEYWGRVLPKSPYYFVGIMERNDIDSIEPLTITPKPATILRVRLFFEPLKNWVAVTTPVLTAPQRSGFSVVEWGGLVQVDKESTFACSQ